MERTEAIIRHLEGKVEGKARSDLMVLLNGKDVSYRDAMFKFMQNHPLFKLDYNLSKEGMRHLTRSRAFILAQNNFLHPTPEPEEREKYMQYSEGLSYHDSSINTLIGAQMVLFAGAIFKLGSLHHLQRFGSKAVSCHLRGCFAMTELGHGSNVRGLETTAIYDKSTDEIIINTPTETAQKYWIGGGVEWAQMAAVFAQLIVDGNNYGIHVILVPLRDLEGNLHPGIRVKDCGHKMGLNGMDNARFWFDNVRVPRTNLLDKYGGIDEDGNYNTMIQNNDTRFAVTMGNLLTGRVSISRGSTNVCKIALTTAIRYGFSRKQFGIPGNETPIIEYMTHQARLMPLLATTFANHFIAKKVTSDFLDAQDRMDIEAIKNVHIIVSGLKAVSTWNLAETLQVTREACGGQGYKSSNRIGILKADADIQLTYEGDNSVLLQQVTKELMKGEGGSRPRYDSEIRERKDEASLRDSGFQLLMFQLREFDLVARMREAKKSGVSFDQALQDAATIATEAGRAFVELQILRELINVEQTTSGETKKAISTVRNLYAITRLDSSSSFLREQYFTKEKQQEIHKIFVKLCQETKKISLELVNAFEIPEYLLGDIAGDWEKKFSFFSEDSI